MIGRLNGVILDLRPPHILLDVAGVGYEIDVPISDCAKFEALNSSVTLYTHLVIREDAHSLFGFLTVHSRDSFRSLIKVSGVGPRIALALLSALSLNELHLALQNGDVDSLTRTPGIGKKLAERMLLELKGKLMFAPDSNIHNVADNKVQTQLYGIMNDVRNALGSLGYNDKEINLVMKQLPDTITDLSSGIREALKLLNKF
ncbi:MAG: Holliday junction branch migration protein RuvA [Burkholderiales bacterium]|jgi:Holliday junction DNA helicase RuvA|nr:Holliday junction branch migration protein RuvA [Burkholderiales bacterium]MCE3268163.1 Holliday junction branch migration protein RuvA [Burkholderiales bacterium]